MSIRHLSQQLYTNINRINKENAEYIEFANVDPNATTIGLLGSWPLKNTDNYLLFSNLYQAGIYTRAFNPESSNYPNQDWSIVDKIQFSGDGRKLFLATKNSQAKGLHEYTLGEPWNLQNVISAANITTEFGYTTGFSLFNFSYDGTSLFFNNNYYTMDTPYDVANARVYYEPIGLNRSTANNHDVDETGLNFYSLDSNGDTLNWFKAKIPNFPYELSNAAVASGFQLDALYQTSSSVTDMKWSPDGKWFYLTIPYGVYQLKVGTPWDVSTVFNPYAKNPHGINVDGPFAFNNTGNLLFTSHNSNIYTTPLSQAWNISSAAGVANIRTRAHTYFANVLETRSNVLNTPNLISFYSPVDLMGDLKRYQVGAQTIKGMSFNPEGNIMLIMAGQAAESTSITYYEQIHRYDLSRPWDLTTAVWQSNLFISDTNKNLDYGTWSPFAGVTNGLAYLNDLKTSSDGKKIYLLNNNHSTIFVLNLANSWDISTAYFYDSLVLQDETGPATFEFSSDGSSLYYAGTQYNPDKITKIELNYPWVLTDNSTTSASISFGTAWNNIKGITLSPDESKIYVAGGTTTSFNTIGQFELDVPGDLTSANTLTYTLSTAGLGTAIDGGAVNRTPSDIRFNKHGNVFYVNNPAYTAGAKVIQSYTLSTPWDLSTASLWTGYNRPSSFRYLGGTTTSGGEWFGPMFDDTGHKVTWVYDTGSSYSYAYNETAAVAWDISTVSSNAAAVLIVGGTNLFNNAIAAQTNTQDAKLGDNGNVLYVLNTRILESWQLNTPYDGTSVISDSPSEFSTNFAGSNYLLGAQAFALNPAGNNLVTVHRNISGTTRMRITGWESKPGDIYPNFSNLYIGKRYDTTAPRAEMLPVISPTAGPHSVEFGDGGNILYINGGSGFYQWPIYNKDDATLDSLLGGSQVFCTTQDFSDIMFNEDGKKLFVTRRGTSTGGKPYDWSKIIETFYLDRAWDLSSSANAWGSRSSTISNDTYRNPPVVTTIRSGAKFVADGRMVVTNFSTTTIPSGEDGFVMVNLKFPYNIDSANTDFTVKTFRNDMEFAGNVMNSLKLRTFLSSTNGRIHTGHHTFIDNGNTMVFTWYPDGGTVGNFRYIASLGMDIPYDFRSANISKVSNVYLPGDAVVIDGTYGLQQYGHRGMFFNDDGTKLWAYAPKTSANVASYTLSTPWDITSIDVDPSPQSLPYNFNPIISARAGFPMDWWLSPTGNVIYIPEKSVGGSGRITSYELATPYDFSTATETGNIILYVANINYNKFASTSYTGGLTASPDGKIVVFQAAAASDNYTTLRLKTPYVISESSVDSGLFNLEPKLGGGTTITAVSSTMSKDGNHLYVLGAASNRGHIFHYNLTIPYEVESAVFANVLSSGGTIATSWFTNCVKVSEDGSKLFVVANSASRPAIQTINLDTPYDTSTASNGQSILRWMGFSPEVFEFTNDGNTIVICGTGTVNTGQQIYQVKLRNPWDLSNAYTFESVSVNPFSLNATNMKYHNGNIWFDEQFPTYPIDAARTFYRMPLDQYGGFNGNVGTDVFNSNIIAYPVHGVVFGTTPTPAFTVTNEGNLFVSSIVEINELYKANTLNYSPYTYPSIKELKYSIEPLRFTADNSLSNNFIKSFNTVNEPFGMNIDKIDNIGPVFSPDGTKMLIKSRYNTYNKMFSFDLSSPWDLSSAIPKGNTILVGPSRPDAAIYYFSVTGDGKRIVYYDYTNKILYCDRMETPWDYSTAVAESFATDSETGIVLYPDDTLDRWSTISTPVFSSNGKYLFILHLNGRGISRFEMTKPFDLSTLNSGYGKYDVEFLTTSSSLPRSLSADPTNSCIMYIDYQNNVIQTLKPKSGKNLNSITGSQTGAYNTTGAITVDPLGIFLKPGGNVLYILDNYHQLRHYEINGYNPSYEIGSNIYSIPLSKYLDGHSVYEGLTFSSDGSKIYVPAAGSLTLPTRLYQLELGTPWDARTITSNNYIVLAANAILSGYPTPGYYSSGIRISPDGTKMFIGTPSLLYQNGVTDRIYQYNLTEAGNIFANPDVDFVKDKFIHVDAVTEDMFVDILTVPYFSTTGTGVWDFIDNGYKIVSYLHGTDQLVTIDLAVPYDITSNKLNYVFFDATAEYTYNSMNIDDTGKNLIITTMGTNGTLLLARHFTMDEPYNLRTFRPANVITLGQFASNITTTRPSYVSTVSIRPDGKSMFTVTDGRIVEVDLGNINYA